MSSTSTVPSHRKLLHGALMPSMGFGTGGNRLSNDAAPAVVRSAIEAGFRMIDTAERYGNEEGIGRAIRDAGIPRDQLFVTTKFNIAWHGVDLARQAFEGSARRLGVDYLDLLRIHWPNPWEDRYVKAWEGLIRLLEERKVRAIGMSNFARPHLERIVKETGVVPDTNQIQLNPYVTRVPERAHHEKLGITTEAWAPLGKAGPILSEPLLAEIAERRGRTAAQIVLRWHLQLGVVPQPGSLKPNHMRENLEALNAFELSQEEMDTISGLNGGPEDVTDPEKFGH